MADGLLGLDPSQIPATVQGLLSQMGPPQQMIDAANKRAQLAFFLGLIGAPKGLEFQQLGTSGLAALNQRDNYIKTQQGLAQENMKTALPLLMLAQKMQVANNFANGGMSQPPVSNGVQPTMANSTLPPGAVGGSGMGGGTPAMFGPSSQPGPTAGPTIPTVPLGTNPTQINGYSPPNYATEMPPNVRQLVAMTLDPATMAKAAEDWSTGTLGRNGLVTTKSGRVVAQVMPDQSGIMYYNANGTPGRFVAYGQDVVNAAANRAGAIKGAETGATESAKAPYTIVDKEMGYGQKKQMTLAQYLAEQQAPPPNGAPVPYSVQGNMSPQDLARIQQDAQVNGAGPFNGRLGVPMPPSQLPQIPSAGTLGGPGLTASPLAMNAVKLAQETAAKTPQAEATNVGETYGKQREAVDTAAAGATTGRATIAQMQDALKYFSPNAATPLRQHAAELAQAYLGLPGDSPLVNKIAGGDISAMQEFGKLAYGNAASQLRALLPGQRLTQMEILQNYVNSPNPGLQKAAISTMLQMQDGMYRWAQDKQQAKEAWVQPPPYGHGTYAGFEAAWNSQHPLTGVDENKVPYVPTLDQVKQQLAAASGQPSVANTSGWSARRIN